VIQKAHKRPTPLLYKKAAAFISAAGKQSANLLSLTCEPTARVLIGKTLSLAKNQDLNSVNNPLSARILFFPLVPTRREFLPRRLHFL